VSEGDGDDQHPARQDEESEAEVVPGEIETEVPEAGPFADSWWAAQMTETRGPLPQAREFGQYEAALPGTGDRIVKLAERAMDLTEREASQRHTIENKIVDANIENQSRGQIIATFFGVVGFAAAIAFVATGRNVAAFVAVLVPLGAFISRFIRRPNGKP